MYLAEPTSVDRKQSSPMDAVQSACSRIPPLFDLENFVAVNPFLGWSDTRLVEAAEKISTGLGGGVLPKLEVYRDHWQNQSIDADDLAIASRRHGQDLDSLVTAISKLNGDAKTAEDSQTSKSVESVKRFISRNLADILSPSIDGSRNQISPQELYEEMLLRASIDKTFIVLGYTYWGDSIQSAPTNYLAVIEWAWMNFTGSASEFENYAFQLLGFQYGWSSCVRGIAWKSDAKDFGLLEALLAFLIVIDHATNGICRKRSSMVSNEDLPIRFCLQDAYEDRLLKDQIRSFLKNSTTMSPDRPEFQVMFCIDVRSEVIRRKLEALSPNVETVGFAGFFGIAADLVRDGVSSNRCPVLLNPNIEVDSYRTDLTKTIGQAIRSAFSSPGAFSLVETFGLGYIGSLLSRAVGRWHKVHEDESVWAGVAYAKNRFGLTLAERIALAESILINSGIGNRLGRTVVLCGHGARSANNSHEASLQCGACGGHCGALNAAMAVEILGDNEVRNELEQRGYIGVQDACFLAGQHDTASDEVSIFERTGLKQDEKGRINEIRLLLHDASSACRKERAVAMRIAEREDSLLLPLLERRANDWSEVRPEWGLARNSTFIAAPRHRTRGADLCGRAFLHDYDSTRDTEDAVLKLILSAPVVVASWINLQYFASTVDNEKFGCGTKALLNRIGSIGVISGNEGDLRPGLPIESVCRPDGTWFHDPVRLQVIVEADTEKIDRVLTQVPDVANLVRNGWMRLFALDGITGRLHLKTMQDEWERFDC